MPAGLKPEHIGVVGKGIGPIAPAVPGARELA